MLERFFALLKHIKEFLSISYQKVTSEHLGFLLHIDENCQPLPFLTDVFMHLNLLNLELQGKFKLVCELS